MMWTTYECGEQTRGMKPTGIAIIKLNTDHFRSVFDLIFKSFLSMGDK